jgi:hypothetical protein
MFETHLFNYLATSEGFKQVVLILLEKKADFNSHDKKGFSAFHLGK